MSRNPHSHPPPPSISVIIPTYREEDYIGKTIERLTEQTAFKAMDMEIIISDYDPENTGTTKKIVDDLVSWKNFHLWYFNCPYKGVGVGRNFGAQNSKGRFLVHFDADSHYNRNDAIDMMVAPLSAGVAEWSMCDILFDEKEIDKFRPDNMGFRALVASGRMSPFAIGFTEVGLAQSRFSFDYVKGFTNFSQLEGLDMTSKLSYAFTSVMRYWVSDVKVIQSARRLIHAQKAGGLLGALNYQNAFRGKDVLKVK